MGGIAKKRRRFPFVRQAAVLGLLLLSFYKLSQPPSSVMPRSSSLLMDKGSTPTQTSTKHNLWLSNPNWSRLKGKLTKNQGYGGTESFLISKKRKLLLCRIEKNGNMNQAILVNRLEGNKGMEHFDWGGNQPENFGLTKSDLDDIMRDPTWTKAVFLRDPLRRTLSGYLSKCVQHEDTACIRRNETGGYERIPGCNPDDDEYAGRRIPNGSCEGFEELEYVDNDVPYPQFVVKLATLLKKHLSLMADPNIKEPVPFNLHFLPQTLFCGGLNATIGWYDYVGLVDEKMGDRIRYLVAKLGAEEDLKDDLDDIFPNINSKKKVHSTHTSDSDSVYDKYYASAAQGGGNSGDSSRDMDGKMSQGQLFGSKRGPNSLTGIVREIYKDDVELIENSGGWVSGRR